MYIHITFTHTYRPCEEGISILQNILISGNPQKTGVPTGMTYARTALVNGNGDMPYIHTHLTHRPARHTCSQTWWRGHTHTHRHAYTHTHPRILTHRPGEGGMTYMLAAPGEDGGIHICADAPPGDGCCVVLSCHVIHCIHCLGFRV